MNTGQYISGAAHIGLIGWALLGGAFEPTPEPFEVTEVAMISTAEFEALLASDQPPATVEEITPPSLPQLPTPEAEAPKPPEDTPPVQPKPEEVTPPRPEPRPDVSAITPSTPPAVEIDQTDVLTQPNDQPETAGPIVPERPKPRPTPRVAPEPVAAPEPEQKVDDLAQDQAVSDAAGDVKLDKQEQTVEEEAATEIVTEAEQDKSTAPARSLRPKSRPSRPTSETPIETAKEKPAPEDPAPQKAEDTTKSAVDDLLAGLATENDTPSESAAPQQAARAVGPPMTAGEKDALRIAVQKCWNTGALSTEALQTTVVVAVNMSPDGTPDVNSIRMVSSQGGSSGSVGQAFQAARRAIIRCGAKGFDLPAEKYEQWREIEMTFNPEKMRIK